MSIKRLNTATAALKDAADEFIAAHAEEHGGHAPILWATYFECEDAVVVCHKSWVDEINRIFQSKGEPQYRVNFVKAEEFS